MPRVQVHQFYRPVSATSDSLIIALLHRRRGRYAVSDRMVVQEASPSPVYGAALLMRLGFAPFRGSNPRASATDLGVRTSDTGSQSCSSDHLRHLVAHWWHERLRTALAGGRRRGLAGHRVGAEMTFQVIGSVRCRPAGRPLVEASEVSWSGFVPDLLSTFAASVLAIPGGLFLDRTQHLL